MSDISTTSWIMGGLAYFLFRLISRVDELEHSFKEQGGKMDAILDVLKSAHAEIKKEGDAK